jgi:hypothetical protein
MIPVATPDECDRSSRGGLQVPESANGIRRAGAFWWRVAAAILIDDARQGLGAEFTVYTLRQYRQNRKAEFLRDYRREARAAAALLGDELTHLRFYFATIGVDYDRRTEVRIEFHRGKQPPGRLGGRKG